MIEECPDPPGTSVACYYIEEWVSVDWREAMHKCKARNATLFKIEDEEEQERVMGTFGVYFEKWKYSTKETGHKRFDLLEKKSS